MRGYAIALAKLACLSLFLVFFACNGDNGMMTGPTPPPADEGDAAVGNVFTGGLLYDRWWTINGGSEPTMTHPASGSTTWRCKECHGWDYQGVNGAYGSGSHFSGIIGVLQASGDGAQKLFNDIKNRNRHNLSDLLSDEDVNDLVEFIQNGTLDMNEVIDFDTKEAMGDAENGRTLWSGDARCHECHGAGGRANPADVPDEARGNPWETLHKIRWGHPGTSMPSAVEAGLSLQQQVDVLAHAQTLGLGN
jgi:thiosulfate dehydrogenase